MQRLNSTTVSCRLSRCYVVMLRLYNFSNAGEVAICSAPSCANEDISYNGLTRPDHNLHTIPNSAPPLHDPHLLA